MIERANLFDPCFVQKAEAGKEEEIRLCIGCLRCLNGIMFGKRIACTVNPSLEPENEDTVALGSGKEADSCNRRRACRYGSCLYCGKRGHHVVLCEKEEEPGGLLRIAAVPIAKQDLTKVVKYMMGKLRAYGVEIRGNCQVTLAPLVDDTGFYLLLFLVFIVWS